MIKQTITVAADGSADYRTIQEAILAIPDERDTPFTVFIRPGVYTEKVYIRKENINLIGEDANTTIIRYNDGARKLREDGSEYGTFNSGTVYFAGSDIYVENLTIENFAGNGNIAGQAVAAYITSDRTCFRKCRFIGYQDTIYTGDLKPGIMKHLMFPDFFTNSVVPIYRNLTRNYFDQCYIEGDVDFIFGSSTAYFNRCEIFSKRLQSEGCSYITAASTPMGQEYGYVFFQCKLTSDDRPKSIYLGRPWRDYAKTAFLQCEMGEHIHPAGWHNWDKAKAEVTSCYIEYDNHGAGADCSERAAFSRQLSNPEVLDYYSPDKVMAGIDLWQPAM